MKLKTLIFTALLLIPFGTKAADTLVKSPSYSAVYYLGEDGKRYVFPNDSVYFSWYSDFSGVTTITDEQLYSSQIGGNVTYKPGSKMVKITTDPKVYAVDKNGTLRWIVGENVASELYGADWARNVADIPDAFFTNYQVGSPVTSAADFNPGVISSISQDKALVGLGAVQEIESMPLTTNDATGGQNAPSSVVVEAPTSTQITFIKEPTLFQLPSDKVLGGPYFLSFKADRPLTYSFDETSHETNPPYSIGRAFESYWIGYIGNYYSWFKEMNGQVTEVLGLEPKSTYSLKVDFKDEEGLTATRTIDITTP